MFILSRPKFRRKPGHFASFALVLSLLPLLLNVGQAHASDDGEYWVSAELGYANKRVSDGFIKNVLPLYGVGVYLDTPLLPLYAHITYDDNFENFNETEIAVGYSYDLVGHNFLAGVLYKFANSRKKSSKPGAPISTEFSETSELFLEYSSAEFYYMSVSVAYTWDFIARGGLLGLGFEVDYDISPKLAISAGVEAELDHGAAEIPELSGFYHIDYYLGFDVLFFGDSGLEISATYVTPQGGAEKYNVSREVVYATSLYFAF